MKLPSQIVLTFDNFDNDIVAHTKEEPSKLMGKTILARLALNLNGDPGNLVLAVVFAEDDALQDAQSTYEHTIGYALKCLLVEAFHEGMRFGLSKPEIARKLMKED